MVNGLIEPLVMVTIATVGGFLNGLLHYSGSIWPKHKRKRVPAGNGQTKLQHVLMLGVVGNTLLGAISGFLIYMMYLWDTPLFQPFPGGINGFHGCLAFFAGFGGTFVIDKGKDWFDKQAVGALLPQIPSGDQDIPVLQGLIREPRTSVAMLRLK